MPDLNGKLDRRSDFDTKHAALSIILALACNRAELGLSTLHAAGDKLF